MWSISPVPKLTRLGGRCTKPVSSLLPKKPNFHWLRRRLGGALEVSVEDGEDGGDARCCGKRGVKGEGAFGRLGGDDQAKHCGRREEKQKAKLATVHGFSAGDDRHANSLWELIARPTMAMKGLRST
jgi:hypothetical protein